MKKSKVVKLLRRKRLRAVKGGLAKLTRLTSLNDSQKQTVNSSISDYDNQLSGLDSGVLRQDGSKLRLPTALADAGESEKEGLMPSALAFFIIFMAVVFIAIVAWRISEMPAGK